VSLSKPIDIYGRTLGDFSASCAEEPYGLGLVREFEDALNIKESEVAREIVEIVAGYTQEESIDRLRGVVD
jgi:hypothetical protein